MSLQIVILLDRLNFSTKSWVLMARLTVSGTINHSSMQNSIELIMSSIFLSLSAEKIAKVGTFSAFKVSAKTLMAASLWATSSTMVLLLTVLT